ncbi:PucR family transcriptional regulator [Nocardiopsis oceani]
MAWMAYWLARESDRLLELTREELARQLPELAIGRNDAHRLIGEAVHVHLQALGACQDHAERGRVALPSVLDRYTRALARHETVSQSVLLRSFERIHSTLWREIMGALRTGRYSLPALRRAEVLERVSEYLFDYFQVAIQQTSHSYTSERTLLDRRAASRRSEVVLDVLASNTDQHTAERALKYDFNAVHVGYVAWVENPSELDRLDGIGTTLCEQLRPRQHLSVPIGTRTVFGWFTCPGDQWRAVARDKPLPPGTHMAWGAPHEGFAGFCATHTDALETKRVSGALEATGSLLFDDVAVISLASRDLASAHAFVSRELGQLASGSATSPRLLQTLRVYLEELASPTRSARRLHVHHNTVIKRVERIEELLGRTVDPASLSLRVAVELAPLVGADRA